MRMNSYKPWGCTHTHTHTSNLKKKRGVKDDTSL